MGLGGPQSRSPGEKYLEVKRKLSKIHITVEAGAIHDVGYATAIISEDFAQRVFKIKCTTALRIEKELLLSTGGWVCPRVGLVAIKKRQSCL
jgi:hypothetical protein